MQQQRKGVPLIVLGVIIVFIGIILFVMAAGTKGNIERDLESYYNYGHKDNTSDVLNGLGIGAVIIGCLLTLIGIVRYVTSGSQSHSTPMNVGTVSSTRFTGCFVNPDRTYEVEINNNGSCVWRQKDEYYRGTYRYTDNNEWTIYIDGYGEAFKFQIKGEDIFVTGGPVNERFFREG